MTAAPNVRNSVAIADPGDPTNYVHPTFAKIVAVSPSDSVDLANAGILLIATGGTLTIDIENGATNVSLTVPAGYFFVKVSRVYSTGTAASGISVLY